MGGVGPAQRRHSTNDFITNWTYSLFTKRNCHRVQHAVFQEALPSCGSGLEQNQQLQMNERASGVKNTSPSRQSSRNVKGTDAGCKLCDLFVLLLTL